MNKYENFGQRNIQLQIPNATETIDLPSLTVIDANRNTTTRVALDEVFDQVSLSYQHDTEALHRFSYYLLLQAKRFAQSIDESDDAEMVNCVKEE